MEERWICNDCGAEFDEPLRRYDFDDGITATITDLCPKCGSTKVDKLIPCNACHVGWQRVKDKSCDKCRGRLEGHLQRFARRFSPAELEVLNDILEGNGLEMFV